MVFLSTSVQLEFLISIIRYASTYMPKCLLSQKISIFFRIEEYFSNISGKQTLNFLHIFGFKMPQCAFASTACFPKQ